MKCYLWICILLLLCSECTSIYFTQSTYELWCQENILYPSSFVYPSSRIGIQRQNAQQHVQYSIVEQTDYQKLFTVKSKRLGDFYFLILNITRPFEINREYQQTYTIKVKAHITFSQTNTTTDQAEIQLRVADSNDNDPVFDVDYYRQNITSVSLLKDQKSLLKFHASDADEIENAQILYEIDERVDDLSLHPLTGDLYLLNDKTKKKTYEFSVLAYDRGRKRDNTNTKTQVKLEFFQEQQQTSGRNGTRETARILDTNETIFYEVINDVNVSINQYKNWNYLNSHRPLLYVEGQITKNFELFIIEPSSHDVEFYIENLNIYVGRPTSRDLIVKISDYRLVLLICVQNRSQCQKLVYRLTSLVDPPSLTFLVKDKIILNEDVPINTYVTKIESNENDDLFKFTYKLIGDDDLQISKFYIDQTTGVVRTAELLDAEKQQFFQLDIQIDLQLKSKKYSIIKTIEITVQDQNDYRPKFLTTQTNFDFQDTYQFVAVDNDRNKETNGRISYMIRSENKDDFPFSIDSMNGTLVLISTPKKENYYFDVVAFDWGQPMSLETVLSVHLHMAQNGHRQRRDIQRSSRPRLKSLYTRRWKKKYRLHNISTSAVISSHSPQPSLNLTRVSIITTTSTLLPSTSTIIQLNVGFQYPSNVTTFRIIENSPFETTFGRLNIYDNDNEDFVNNNSYLSTLFSHLNPFHFVILSNDSTLPPFSILDDGTIFVIDKIDREKRSMYEFDVEIKLKQIYTLKIQQTLCVESFNIIFKYRQKIKVKIYIEDINDNPPQCDRFHSTVDVEENKIQTNIIKMKGYDPDRGDNGTIVYSLLFTSDHFNINKQTGELDVIKPFDREQKESPYLVYIILTDQGQPSQLQTLCTLHVNIIGLNDNVPQFIYQNKSLTYYEFDVWEDMPKHAVFGQIIAYDLDGNFTLRYSLEPNPYVYILPTLGYLKLRRSLYLLVDQTFNISLTVQDDGKLVNRTHILIHVLKVKKSSNPLLINEPAYSLIVNESLPIGSILTNILKRVQNGGSTSVKVDYIELYENLTIANETNVSNRNMFEVDKQEQDLKD
ncbi:unnamed protein product [Didymodactylos carnosus]|uniref:Cadherin domain-containing protein n=1 Tax=Didymodactylos carnosus TaxID=1234261 RepID=A0A8S2DL60_9BILA|nr:unnamed protein product [Didymodactylos carnosus]CAF3727585.1 unnamed protein product [Didymodactylos carnosus]